MRLAVIPIIALTIALNLNSPQPILEPHRVAHSDNVVVSFVKEEINQPQFPDRTDAHQHAVNLDIAKEASRLQAIEAQRQADIANQPKVVSNTPQIAPQSPDSFITALGQCESGNTANRNSGNGYYGAFQFSIATWNAMGTGYARADLAPYEVQVAAVKKLLSKSSVRSQFPGCSAKLGL